MLTPTGRVEIVDDELYFPEIQRARLSRLRGGSLKLKSSSKSDDSGDESTTTPVFKRSPTYGERSYTMDQIPTRRTYGEDIETKVAMTENMEAIFTSMLRHRYKIHTHPSEFLKDLLVDIFGDGRAHCLYSATISVPKSDAVFEKRQSTPTPGSSKTLGRPVQGKRSSLDESSRQGGFVTPKAMRILGEAVANTPTPRYQPPGFIVSVDNTFVPCEVAVLEQHACKFMHTLLSCKQAIGAYVQERTDDSGQSLITKEEFDSLVEGYDRWVLLSLQS